MNTTELLSSFLRRLTLWINDNIGDGDGTQLIENIWKDEPQMAGHLRMKWLSYCDDSIQETGQDASRKVTHLYALQRLILSLDAKNMETFCKYIAENGRT